MTQQEILDTFEKYNGVVTFEELCNDTPNTQRTVTHTLSKLREQGIIQPCMYYILTDTYTKIKIQKTIKDIKISKEVMSILCGNNPQKFIDKCETEIIKDLEDKGYLVTK